MRKPIVAGNWKMNGSFMSIQTLLAELNEGLFALENADKIDIAVFPTSVYLSEVAKLTSNSPIKFGAQTLSEHASGAFTGEVSAQMLVDLGCSCVLVGHSERRQLFGESDQDIANKFSAALEANLQPVLCVGETLQEREAEATLDVVKRQISVVVEQSGIDVFADSVIAYEPVWAIGTGKTATPAQAQDVHKAIREMLATYDASVAAKTRILYGGSVSPKTAAELFAQPDVDGGLVGGASLKAQDFTAICRAASSIA